jgi:hypothetical protein
LQYATRNGIPLLIATEQGKHAMIRSAILLSAMLVAAGPAGAATYSATLATPTNARVIAPDISWRCGAAACQGSTEESRPIVLCESLARRAGRVESFVVDGRAFTADELQRCNAAVKAKHGEALAAQ